MHAYIKILELCLYDFSLYSEGQFPSFWLCVIYILSLQCKYGEGNLIFCCAGSRENYFGSVGRQKPRSGWSALHGVNPN